MSTIEVNLEIKKSTEKAYLTTCGWLPKSVVVGMVGKEIIVTVQSWIVSKNEELKKNAEETKKNGEEFNLNKFGTKKPSLCQIASAIEEKEEDEGKFFDLIVKDFVYKNK